MIVREAPREHYAWIAERAHLQIGSEFRALEAVDEHGRIHGMVGHDGWTENACCVHIALENPAALRHLLKPGFGVPFIHLGLGVVLAPVISTNERSITLINRLGFRFLCRIVDGWRRGVDLLWFEMRKEDCRWIRREA